MLVMSRTVNEEIVISDGRAGSDITITVSVVEIRPDMVRLGINAPKEVPVHRGEVFQFIKNNPQDFPTKPFSPEAPAPLVPLPASKTAARKKPRNAHASARQKLRRLKTAVRKLERELDAREKKLKKSLTQPHWHDALEAAWKLRTLGQRIDAARKRITKKK